MKKKFKVLIISNSIENSNIVKDIFAETQNNIYEVETTTCFNSSLERIAETIFSIILLDADLCNFDQIVLICEKARKSNPCTILVIVVNKFHDFLFDRRLLDIPVDDFYLKPFNREPFKGKLLLWSIRYRKRVLNSIDMDAKMKGYQECLDEMVKLENSLREILGINRDG